MQNNIYDGQFRGNILVVGKTGCGKSSFVQKFCLNNFFGKSSKIEWVSSIFLSKTRDAEIQACFNAEVEFHYAEDTGNYDDISNSMFGENKIMDRLIVMDNVPGITDSCKEFTDFLTITRKHRYNCIYIFYNIIPDKDIWKKITSHIFPASVPFHTVSKTLQSNCVPTTTKYVPVFSMWQIKMKKTCLTIDCSGNNKNGPGWYRTQANNLEKQVCYFNEPLNNQVYNSFISERTKCGNFEKGIHFKIDRVKSKTDSETFSVKQKLEYINGTSNVQLSERNPGKELYRRVNGNGKFTKQYEYQSIYRKSSRPRFLSRQHQKNYSKKSKKIKTL